ncbi:MAG: hypothetical protein QNJ34_10375 [Xenococcaceae cyanobacterium MO_188.B29]|nr:hypothetical protein [Xenococcaceae cyanobacterium MO_188.B29]
MALKPCKVCGTLNAEGVETCLSCGHAPEGTKKPAIFRYVAIALIICLALPLLSGLLNLILLKLKPESPTPSQSQVSLQENHYPTC